MVDYALQAYKVLLRCSPTDFLRKAIYENKPLDVTTFNTLVSRHVQIDKEKDEQQRSLADLRRS